MGKTLQGDTGIPGGDKTANDSKSSVTLAVFYGCGVGLAIVSYLIRSGLFKFVFHKPYEGSVTVIDVLGYPKQQDIFWYVAGLAIPLICGILYGFIESRARADENGIRNRIWWVLITIFLIQAPLLAISRWPGTAIAIIHLIILAFMPVTGKFLIKYFGKGASSILEGIAGDLPDYKPIEWFIPVILVVFAGFISHSYITMHTVSRKSLVGGTFLWAILIGLCYYILFKLLSKYSAREDSFIDGATWGLIPLMILPIYHFAWGREWFFAELFCLAMLSGSLLFICSPGIKPYKPALMLMPLAIGVALHFSPHYRFASLDMVHEGQNYAFAQCIMRGMLPGVEKAIKYGPLLELTEGWTMMLFGAQMWIMRLYFIFTQIFGYWFGCLLILELVRRRWLVVFGWFGYLVFTIASLYHPGNYNGLRAGFPILAIYFFSLSARGGRRSWLIASGVAGAIGAVYSIEFGLAGVIALVAGVASVAFVDNRNRMKTAAGDALLLAGGAAIVAIPFTLLYLKHGGIFVMIEGMYEHAQAFRLGYGAFPLPNFPWIDRPELYRLGMNYITKRLDYYIVQSTGIVLGAILIARLISKKWTFENAVHVSLLVYAIFGFRSTLGRADFIHNLNSMAPVVVIIFILLDRLIDNIRAHSSGARDITAPLIINLIFAFLTAAIPLSNFGYAKETMQRFMSHHIQKDYKEIESFYLRSNYAPFNIARARGIWTDKEMVKQVEQLTEFINRYTSRDERIHIAPMHGIYFFFADRLPLTRYCLPFDAILPQARAQVLEQIKQAKPRFVFIQLYRGMDFLYSLEHPDEIRYIFQNYQQIGVYAETFIYKRKGIQ